MFWNLCLSYFQEILPEMLEPGKGRMRGRYCGTWMVLDSLKSGSELSSSLISSLHNQTFPPALPRRHAYAPCCYHLSILTPSIALLHIHKLLSGSGALFHMQTAWQHSNLSVISLRHLQTHQGQEGHQIRLSKVYSTLYELDER